jgi:hypothetical protein
MRIHYQQIAILVLWASATQAQDPFVFQGQHVDIGLAEPDGLELHYHNEDALAGEPAEYEPSEALVLVTGVDNVSKFTAPSGSQWSFLGVPEGDDLWVLPRSTPSSPLVTYLGIGSEEANLDNFGAWNPLDSREANTLGKWFELRLVSVDGAGHFSAYQAPSPNAPVPYMSTAETPGNGNRLHIQDAGHNHWNFAFGGTGDLFN